MSVSYVRLAGQTGSSLLGCCFLAANVNYEELCLLLSDITGLPPIDYPSLHIFSFSKQIFAPSAATPHPTNLLEFESSVSSHLLASESKAEA